MPFFNVYTSGRSPLSSRGLLADRPRPIAVARAIEVPAASAGLPEQTRHCRRHLKAHARAPHHPNHTISRALTHEESLRIGYHYLIVYSSIRSLSLELPESANRSPSPYSCRQSYRSARRQRGAPGADQSSPSWEGVTSDTAHEAIAYSHSIQFR